MPRGTWMIVLSRELALSQEFTQNPVNSTATGENVDPSMPGGKKKLNSKA